jgi:hypothetical protein
MESQRWARWSPRVEDVGVAIESAHERAVLGLYTARLSEDEECRRSFRAAELDRIATEIRRAAVAVFDAERDRPQNAVRGELLDVVRVKILNSRLVTAMAALNLMGLDTLLPAESPFTVAVDMPAGTRIYLQSSVDCHGLALSDRLDALGGLINDFRRSTLFVSGLRVEPVGVSGHSGFALLAGHPELMSAFGDFLAHKYIIEGWNLY